MSPRLSCLHSCPAMDDAITEDGSADRLFLLMLYTGARAMDGPDDRDVALADSVSSHGTRG